jgi:uncharacterized protein YdcH (DUF465 family)
MNNEERKPPKTIYLQFTEETDDLYGATWCEDKINPTDTEYVLASEKDAEIQRLTEERNAVSLDWYKAEKEIQRLQDWKESAMAVWPDMQKIGELIGVKLGGSVHDKIIPAIEKLQAEIQHLKSQRVKDIEDAIDFVHTNMGTLCDYDEFLKAKSEYLKPFTAEVNNKK